MIPAIRIDVSLFCELHPDANFSGAPYCATEGPDDNEGFLPRIVRTGSVGTRWMMLTPHFLIGVRCGHGFGVSIGGEVERPRGIGRQDKGRF